MYQSICVILFATTLKISVLLMLFSLYDLKKITMPPVEHAKTRVILFLSTILIVISTLAIYSKLN